MSEIKVEKLGGSEAVFKTIVDESMIGFAIIQDGLVKYVNQGVANIFGYSIEEMMKWKTQEFLKAVHPQDKRKVVKTLKRITSEKRKPLELRIKAKNDKYIWIEINSKKIKYDNQKGVILTFRNISDRKDLEQKFEDNRKNFENLIHSIPEIRLWKLFYPKNYEVALKTSYEMLQKVIDNIPGNIFWKDTNLVYLGCNQNYANLVGVGNPENLISQTDKNVLLDDLLSKDKIKELEEKETSLLKSNKPEYHIVESWNLKNGEKIWFDTNRIPLYDSENNVVGIVVTYNNITERMIAEEKLKQAHSELDQIFNSSMPMYVVDTDFNNIRVNDAYCSLLQMKKEDILGKKCYDILKGPNCKTPGCSLCRILEGEDDFEYEVDAELDRGNKLSLIAKTVPYRSAAGTIVGAIKTLIDITERKKAEEELKTSEKRFRTIAENFPNGAIVLYDHDLRYILAEGEVLEKVGLTSEKMVGNNLRDLVTDEYYNALAPHYKAALNGETHRFEFEFGGIIHDTSTLPIKDSDGNIIAGMSISRDINERKRAEEELRLQSVIMTNLSEGVHLIRMDDGIIVYTNPRFEEIFGYDPGELIGKHISIVNAPTDKNPEETTKGIIEILEETGEWHGEVNNIKKDGTPFWCYANVSVFDHPVYGKVTVAIQTDITEQRKVDEINLKLAAIVENSDDAIIGKTLDGTIISWNKGAERIYSYTSKEVIGKPISILVPSDRPDQVPGILKRIKAGDCIDHFETVRVRKDGEEINISLTISPIEDKDGSIIGASTIARDITERKKAEEELRLHSVIMTNLSEGVNLTRMDDGIIVYTNPRFEEIFGYDPGELIGKHISIVNAPTDKDPEETAKEIKEILEERGEWHGEVNNIKKDGTPFWCYANVSVFDHPVYGKVTVAIHTDITERKKAEKVITDLAKFPSENPNPVLRATKEKVIYINEAGEKLFNVIEGESVPLLMLDTVNEVFSVKEIKRLEIEHGNLTYSYVITPVEAEDYVNIYGRDITERKKAEEKIKESEEKYKALSSELEIILDNVPAIIYSKNKDDIVLRVNQYFANALNLNKEDMIGKTTFDLFLIDQAEAFRKDDLEVISSGKPKLLIEEPWNSPKGTRWALSSKIPYYNDKGDIIGVIGIAIDITERKRAEEKLKQAHSELDQIFNISLPMHVIDKDFNIIRVNDTYCSLLKKKREDLLGKKCYDVWKGPNCNTPRCSLCLILEGEDEFEYEVDVELDRGNKLSLIANAVPFRSAGGTIVGAIKTLIDITDRKKVELKLKESEEKYRGIFNESVATIYVFDENRNFIDSNQAGFDLLGYSSEELLTMSIPEVDADPVVVLPALEQLLSGDRLINYEHQLRRKDGKIITVLNNSRPLTDINGNVYGMQSTLIDITERKLTEQKLKESEEKLRTFMDSATDSFILFDSELNYIDFNEVTLRMLGLKKEDLIGKNILDMAPNLKETGRYDKYLNVIKTGKPFITEDVIYNRLDGSLGLYLSIRAFKVGEGLGIMSTDISERKKAEKVIADLAKFPSENPNPILRVGKEKVIYTNEAGEKLFNIIEGESVPLLMLDTVNEVFSVKEIKRLEIEHGNQIYSYVITPVEAEDYVNIYGRDITERKKAEEKIKESEEILKKFINSATDGFLLFDSKFNLIQANRNAINILEINIEDNTPKKISEITLNFGENSKYDELTDVIKTGMPFLIEDRLNHSKLGIIDVAISAFNVGNGLGLILTNITKHKRIEQELKEMSDLKTELLTRTSHELKTPLVSIKGNADFLLKEYSERFDFETIVIMEEIKNGCLRLEDLINDLLKSSKLETNQIELKASYDDLVFLIKFTVNELKGLVDARNQKVLLELHDKLNTKFEKEKIFEVISNLLSNAIKYTPSGGEIKIKTEITDDYYIVSVKDSGIGFTKEEKQRIFKQFGKIERYGRGLDLGIEGSGLGLYISKKIAELHGGKIWMESEGKNKGSTFLFSLPIIK